MRRVFGMLLCLVLLLAAVPVAAAPLEGTIPFPMQSKAAVLMDARTGILILAKNENQPMPIASVTKVMTLLMVFEAIETGNISPETGVQISENAAGMGGSQAFLGAGLTYTVDQLIKTVIIASANDSAVALAELVGGTEEAFVGMMNARAAELGMAASKFANPTGLTQEGHVSCANDVAVMSRQLIRHEGFFHYSRIWLEDFAHPDGRTTQLTNTNRLIRFYDGADGTKTGFTDAAMFCLSATAKRGDQRFIAVVLGAPTSEIRFAEAQKLMDYGFAQYASVSLAHAGVPAGRLAVENGQLPDVAYSPKESVQLLLKRGQEREVKTVVTLPEGIVAPVAAGQVVGHWVFTQGEGGEELARVELTADYDVARVSFWFLLNKIFHKMVVV